MFMILIMQKEKSNKVYKMFCNSCGSKLKESDKFCENCGASIEGTPEVDNFQQQPYQQPQQQPYQQQPYQQPQQQQYSGPYQQPTVVYQPSPIYSQRKSPGLAVVLSIFVLLGSGQMYGGKVGRGFGFLFGVFGITIFFIVSFVLWWTVAWYLIPVVAGLQIWCHIDAYRVTEKYNRFLHTHNRPPTNLDNW
ncbi:hypothetical protein ES707_11720 [subsurface metagenome]